MFRLKISGTGLWSVVEALEAAVPAPSLVAAVLARQMSMLRSERMANATMVALPKVQQATRDTTRPGRFF